MKRPTGLIIIFVIVACFILGVLNVLLQSRSDDGQSITPLPPTPTGELAESSVKSILIVGVDDLDSNNPELRSVWIAVFRTPVQELYMHGIPLDIKVSAADGTSLEDLFILSPEGQLTDIFQNAIYQILPVQPDLIVVLDDVAFATLVDFLGGVNIDGAPLDGQGILDTLRLFSDDSESLLRNQENILRLMVPLILAQPESPELTVLMDLIPRHVYLSRDASEAIAFIYPLRSLYSDSIFFILVDTE
ncbi:MAG: hypothetical protein GTO18_02835 [Anaerolineales bacterium]|nr:hypothetical protein [Anaerolineales bacterium]